MAWSWSLAQHFPSTFYAEQGINKSKWQLSPEIKGTLIKGSKKCAENSELLSGSLISVTGVPGLAQRLCIKGHPQSSPPALCLDALRSAHQQCFAGARLQAGK